MRRDALALYTYRAKLLPNGATTKGHSLTFMYSRAQTM